ncbi:MAG: hypothetical protein Q9204_007991, partial [Flavoplaca sp. TL-2023a]
SYWGEFSLEGIEVKVTPPKMDAFPGRPAAILPYFWGGECRIRLGKLVGRKPGQHYFPIHPGYLEVRDLIGNGMVVDLKRLSFQAQGLARQIFCGIEDMSDSSSLHDVKSLSYLKPGPTLVQLRLSPELESWKAAQHVIGNILPAKGAGLSQASDNVLDILKAAHWPEALKTNNALFGCGIASLLMGAADVPTMFSNYVTDMAFYYEHGYNYIFPSLESLLQKGLADPQALRTPGGRERREAICVGKQYIQGKIALERKAQNALDKSIISLSESSLLGMAAEAIARDFDPGAVINDLVFSSPGTDVVDIGCDLVNSEVMNSFLNVSDITDTGIVSEDVLRRVYDAYAATGARMLTQRWHEPVARMCTALYTWHIQNDRHMFFRRAILGRPKARKTAARPQREADFDEVFDEQYRTTGFHRPLDPEYACNGEETCNHVYHFLDCYQEEPLLRELWWILVVEPLDYVRGGQIDERREHDIVEGSRLLMAKLYSRGLVLEM